KTHEDVIIKEHIRPALEKVARQFPGMKYVVEEVEEGPPGGYDVAVRVTGDDLEQLGEVAGRLALRIGQQPGAVDVGADYRDENPEIVIEPNPWAVGLFDTQYAAIAGSVNAVINGDTSILLSIDDEDVTLRIQAQREYQRTLDELARTTIIASSGRRASIQQLATLRRDSGLYAVNRYERSRAVVAHCGLADSVKSETVFAALRADALPAMGFEPIAVTDPTFLGRVRTQIKSALGMDTTAQATAFVGRPGTSVEGVRATFTGENEEMQKNFNYLLQCMIIAVILIFGILVFQFNSLRQSIIVLLSVPLSFIGVVAGMWLCGFPFSLASFIGLVSLAGIVVNDAIVVVDFVNQARARGLPTREAIIEAGVNRLRPVFLTTATTVGGLAPLALNISGGAEFWQPLCGAIIFGLSVATLLTLYVVPVCYDVVYRWFPGRPAAGSPA
ncbi:MAG: efflux RND transporter permease subunit, partial [Planctomycetales bacterium]|nr:efflux RND transporter permease subunit [Planctomycetales bacterium]